MDRWKCTDGVVRDLDKMPPMHLGMICKMLETKDTPYNRYKLRKIGAMVIRSGLTVEGWIANMIAIKKGRFKFYEDSPMLDEYYRKLVSKYKIILAPRCLQYKDRYPCLVRDMQYVSNMLQRAIWDRNHDYGVSRAEAESINDEISDFLTKSAERNFFEGNSERIIEIAGIKFPSQIGWKYYTREEIKAEIDDAIKEVYFGADSGEDCVYWPCKSANGFLWAVVLGYDHVEDVFRLKMAFRSENVDLDKSYDLDWYMPYSAQDELEITLPDNEKSGEAVDYLLDHFCM